MSGDPELADAADKIAIVRKFILSAPAGELRDVLKPLRTLTANDHVFFSVVSDCCLEYHLRHQSCFEIPPVPSSSSSDSTQRYVVITSKANHLVSRMKQFCKQQHKPKLAQSAVDVLVADYFASGKAHLGAAVTELPGGEEVVEGGFEDISRVFFDYNAAVYFEIDPVESRVTRTLPFLGGVVASDNGEETSSAASLVYEAVESVLAAESADYFGVAPYLIAEVGAYVAKNYLESNVDERSRMLMGSGGGGASAGGGRNTTSSLSLREPLSHCASHVSVAPSGSTITVSITSERYQPKSFWAGRWKSIFVVSTAEEVAEEGAASDDELGVCIVGETRVHTHSFEDGGNIHMEVTKTLPKRIIYSKEKQQEADGGAFNVASIAKKILKEIKAYETAIQGEMEQCCGSIGETALKGLRRKLPISKQEYNFRKGSSSVSSRTARHD